QWEAARSTGLSFAQALASVVMPQAIRIAIPLLTNRTIAITKGTALASVISVPEILDQAQSAMSLSANASPLVVGGMLYLAIFAPFVAFSRWLERRFGWIIFAPEHSGCHRQFCQPLVAVPHLASAPAGCPGHAPPEHRGHPPRRLGGPLPGCALQLPPPPSQPRAHRVRRRAPRLPRPGAARAHLLRPAV